MLFTCNTLATYLQHRVKKRDFFRDVIQTGNISFLRRGSGSIFSGYRFFFENTVKQSYVIINDLETSFSRCRVRIVFREIRYSLHFRDTAVFLIDLLLMYYHCHFCYGNKCYYYSNNNSQLSVFRFYLLRVKLYMSVKSHQAIVERIVI